MGKALDSAEEEPVTIYEAR